MGFFGKSSFGCISSFFKVGGFPQVLEWLEFLWEVLGFFCEVLGFLCEVLGFFCDRLGVLWEGLAVLDTGLWGLSSGVFFPKPVAWCSKFCFFAGLLIILPNKPFG